MDENKFWELIENAWNADSRMTAFRNEVMLTLGSPAEKESFEKKHGEGDPLIPHDDVFIGSLQDSLKLLSQEDLRQFDQILERKLFDIDREEVHEHTDGSDDGFLYCRGFIVAIGKQYYDSINENPGLAIMDWECEEMTYISWHIYTDKYGEMPDSGISRETGNNAQGWPPDDG